MKKRILIADDDTAILTSLACVLEAEEYEVATARSAPDAIRQFVLNAPNLVLLDLNMAPRDGWGILDIVSRCDSSVPVVIITGFAYQCERALSRSVDAVLEKPLDLDTLLDVVETLLAESEQDRRLRLGHPGFAPYHHSAAKAA